MWTLMYRGGLLAGACAVLFFVLWQVLAARRERARLEALVASRTRQLRQSEELFRSIFEHASEGIFQSTLDGRNLRANPAMARICGYDDPGQMQRELTDVSARFYVQPGRRAQINAAIATDEAAVDWESEIRRRDGTTVWISENVHAVVDPATGETVYQGSIVDITARRQMQAAQEHARLAAEAAHAARAAFLAHVTHELRTPLTGILSNARVALRDPSTDEKNRARYDLIASSGAHLLALIDEVLDLSRIEADRLELRPVPFPLPDFLHTVADAFRTRAAEKRLDFRCDADLLLPAAVHGDPVRLRQVLDNLLGNAFKFTTLGGATLRVRRVDAAAVHFEVADTGIGIPADQLGKIFEPFHQSPRPDQPARPGVGLGLHIGARLVALMGGELRVESTPDQGSRFYFGLPLPPAEPLLRPGDMAASPLAPAPFSPPSPLPPSGSSPTQPPPDRPLPSAPDLDALLTLSLEGDIVRLRARLKELAARDLALVPFVRELDTLAADFRMDALTDHLRRVAPTGVSAPHSPP